MRKPLSLLGESDVCGKRIKNRCARVSPLRGIYKKRKIWYNVCSKLEWSRDSRGSFKIYKLIMYVRTARNGMRTLCFLHKVLNALLERGRTRLEGVVCVQVPPPPLAEESAVESLYAANNAAFKRNKIMGCELIMFRPSLPFSNLFTNNIKEQAT